MHTHSKLALAGLAATLLMGLAVGSASANRLSVSNQNIRVTWEKLTLFGEGGGSAATIECPITLEGSFVERTITKVLGALIGRFSRGTIAAAACTGGRATMLPETLPWHITYEGFTGRLPAITTIRLLIRGTRIAVEANGGLGTVCLYGENGTTGNAAGEAIVGEGGLISGFTVDEAIRLPILRRSGIGGFACPPEGGFSGSGRVTLLGNIQHITITLI